MVTKDDFLKGSLFVFISLNLFNFFNYLFHFSSARLLGPEEYAVLGVVMGFVYIFSIPSDTIQTVISRYTTKFVSANKEGNISILVRKSLRKLMALFFLCFLAFIAISPVLAKILGINFFVFALVGIVLLLIPLYSISRGVLQGTKQLGKFGLSYILEGFLKVLIAISLILIGFGIYGPVGALVLSSSVAVAFTWIVISKKIKKPAANWKKISIEGIYRYGFPTLISLTSIVLIYSMDLILVKAFFPAEIAGKYSVISMLGKIVIFLTLPISRALLPYASENYDKKRDQKAVLKKSYSLVILSSLAVILVYAAFPKFVIGLLFGSAFIDFSGYLFFAGLSMFFLGITNLIVFTNLSINKVKRNYFVFIFFILQLLGLLVWHSTIMQFILVILIVNALLTIFMALMSIIK